MIFQIWIKIQSMISVTVPYREKGLGAFFDALVSGSHFHRDMAALETQQQKFIDMFQRLSRQLDGGRTIQ
jgi:hypothetical protein